MTARSLVIIEVETTTKEDVAEALFDFGIGEPDEEGNEWPNMAGMDYKVINYKVKEIQ